MPRAKEVDTQITGLGGDATPEIGLTIRFPTSYSDADKDAIWTAIEQVQVARGLKES